jgi:hypothetical protein
MVSPEKHQSKSLTKPPIYFEDIGRAANNPRQLAEIQNNLRDFSYIKGLKFVPKTPPSILYLSGRAIKSVYHEQPLLKGLTNSQELISRLESEGVLEKQISSSGLVLKIDSLSLRDAKRLTPGIRRSAIVANIPDAKYTDQRSGKVIRYGTIINKERYLTQYTLGMNTGLQQFWSSLVLNLVVGKIEHPVGSEEITTSELSSLYEEIDPRIYLGPVSELNRVDSQTRINSSYQNQKLDQ